MIQEITSNGSENKISHFNHFYGNFFLVPKKAFGDIIPVLLATTMAIPVSRNGTVKSTNA